MKTLRVGLFTLIAFTVAASGVVEVWSESVLEIGAAVLLLIWLAELFRGRKPRIHWSPLAWPLLGLIAIGALQIIFRVTSYSYLTRTELLKLVVYFILFFLFTQAFRDRAALAQVAAFLILLGFVAALLAIIQHFTSQGEIFWFRKPLSGGDVFGPYVNRNHFAGFIELVVPIGMAMLVFRGVRRDLVPLTGLLTIVPVGALILSGSRGGIISFAFEIAILFLLTRLRRRRGKDAPRMVAVAVIAFAALALIVWLGPNKTIDRFSGLSSNDVSAGRRVSMARGAIRIFLHYPIAGTGLGTLVAAYPFYETAYDGKLVDHVHNDYLELLADAGLLGGLCGLAFLWALFREARRSFIAEQAHLSRAIHAGAIAAVCGLLLHSFVDFNLHIPSNAILFLLQACLATSLPVPVGNDSPGSGARPEFSREGSA
ncbi:MAG: O-antigen ligase family protein [Candidatus Acidiferrales bacterium]